MFVSSTIIAIGIAVPWVLKSQFSMFVYAALMGLGYGIYMVVDQALNVDVLPKPNEAGKALGILNLATHSDRLSRRLSSPPSWWPPAATS